MPPATASLLVRRVVSIMVTAVGLGALAVWIGLLISFHHGSAAGATLALVAVVMFLVVLTGRELARGVARLRANPRARPSDRPVSQAAAS